MCSCSVCVQNLMSQYTSRMGRLLKKYGRSLPSRVRFQLEDLLELRAKGWQFQTVGQVAAAEQNAALPLAAMQQLRGLYEWMEDRGSTSENSSEAASGGRDDLLAIDPFVEQSTRSNGVYRPVAATSSNERTTTGTSRTAAAATVGSVASSTQQQQQQPQQTEKQNGSGVKGTSKPEQAPMAVAPPSVDWTELDQMPSSLTSTTGHHLEPVPAHFDWASTTPDPRPARTEREAEAHSQNVQTPAPPKPVVSKPPKPLPQVAPDALFLPAFCKVDYAAKAAAAKSTRNAVRPTTTIPFAEPANMKTPERPPSTGSVSNSSEASQGSAAAMGGVGDASNALGGEAGKKTKRLVLLHSTGKSGGEAGRGAQFDAADLLTPAFARGRYVVPKASDGDARAAKRTPPGTAWNKVGVQHASGSATGGQLQQQQQPVATMSSAPGSTPTAAINSAALDAFLPQFASVSLAGGQPSRRAANRSSPRARE